MYRRTKKITTIAMLSAVAYLAVAFGRIPMILFLKYDPKDVVIAIGGFLFGPLTAAIISVLVSAVELFTISTDGPIGLLMNILSSCAFSCTAAFFYKKRHTLKGAVTGLVAGVVFTVLVMLLWNYLITPYYMKMPREAVVSLLPAILLFNVIKGSLNAALTMLLYKPVVISLRKAGLAALPVTNQNAAPKRHLGIILISLAVLATCVLVILSLQGKF